MTSVSGHGRAHFSHTSSHQQASTSFPEFHRILPNSTRILALCGAGLSASSGLDTFRGKGGMWKNHDAKSLATPEAFERDPGLVWGFYSYRRHRALQANPNKGHEALAELARKRDGFMCLTQNVDGLSQRASHPPEQLKLLHGSLFDIKCNNCTALIKDNYDDPFHPSLAVTDADDARLAASKRTTDAEEQLPQKISRDDLPHCPSCKTGLQRPGVVWFGEPLPEKTLEEIDTWLSIPEKIDLMLVVGTTATVFPAAAYVDEARMRGARIVVINNDDGSLGSASQLTKRDFLFVGDAAELLPELFKPVFEEKAEVKGSKED